MLATAGKTLGVRRPTSFAAQNFQRMNHRVITVVDINMYS